MKCLLIVERWFIIVFALVLLTTCSNDLDTETFDDHALVTVKFQGTPSAFTRVQLDIVDVQLRVLDDLSNPNAWVSLTTRNPGVYDITSITGNTVLALVDFEEIPSTFIHSIRVVFGNRNTVVKNNIEYTVTFDSQFDNTSTNIVGKQLKPNTVYEFTLVLDTDRSIVVNANGSVHITPNMSTNLSLFNLF